MAEPLSGIYFVLNNATAALLMAFIPVGKATL